MTKSYLLKIGGWSQQEDEVLKVSVMKYGLNQWDKIQSLFQRKTQLQCKTRWEEWVSPGVDKKAWTIAEDGQLLGF